MDTKYLLGFSAHPKIGSQILRKILNRSNNNIEKAWFEGEKYFLNSTENSIGNLIVEARQKYNPDLEIEKLKKLDSGYITIFDKFYPDILKQVNDSPIVLYAKGNLEILNKKSIAVVGSRKFSDYGRYCAYEFSKLLVENNLCVVSGLALGIDSIAHKGALSSGGMTTAVIGSGLDQIYPASNFALSQEIIQKGGIVVSEFPPGTPPLKYNFPIRNRIIAGLSMGVLVIEAVKKSGSLITAYCALDYNRDVFAIPGNINSVNSEGTNELIKEGAKLVTCIDDILIDLNLEKIEKSEKAKAIIPDTPEEKIIYDLLCTGKKSVDKLVIDSNLNIVIISSLLSMMEIKGLIIKDSVGDYLLAKPR